MSIPEQVLDDHCAEKGFIVPSDPVKLRAWLLDLVERAHTTGQWDQRIRSIAWGRHGLLRFEDAMKRRVVVP